MIDDLRFLTSSGVETLEVAPAAQADGDREPGEGGIRGVPPGLSGPDHLPLCDVHTHTQQNEPNLFVMIDVIVFIHLIWMVLTSSFGPGIATDRRLGVVGAAAAADRYDSSSSSAALRRVQIRDVPRLMSHTLSPHLTSHIT
jgi:hypothetical protein